ncbi:MAG TPA: hypothetical protein ENN81_04315 [Phycisphaerales bacterium]|nr:hypothetical protein [Phycisphaerales bacterium]
MDSRTPMSRIELEKYSSAITLSDMEVFVFPELMYSLVLANIMSPILWRWREQECFRKLKGKTAYRKLMRLKQYIMDEFDFNLDLETWGLTRKDVELARFVEVISAEDISRSNALFGYHGDQYYFDVDIRKHFGLDKYDSDAIPYWKTETVEAMNAFRLKPGYGRAAGECVSLAALYAAAAFIVCGIPLEDIYMILTPLHSQNFIDMQGGILTNNRRLVTKAMWFNGTEISNKAQRALRNEQVTIVSHCSGYVHCFYDRATIGRGLYEGFRDKLSRYLSADLTPLMFANFLRSHSRYQKYFQICRDCHGQPQYVKAEVLFHYEHSSPFRVADTTHEKLLAEVADEDLTRYELPGRLRCDQICEFLERNPIDPANVKHRDRILSFVSKVMPGSEQFVRDLVDFVHVEPRLPAVEKDYQPAEAISISPKLSREAVIQYLASIRGRNTTADLAFYAYRDMATCRWEPFVKAALERNPVCVVASESRDLDHVYSWLLGLGEVSIYDGQRLAQPDEVANYGTGDGLEKAFLMAAVVRWQEPTSTVAIRVDGFRVGVTVGLREWTFVSKKGLSVLVQVDQEGRIGVARV